MAQTSGHKQIGDVLATIFTGDEPSWELAITRWLILLGIVYFLGYLIPPRTEITEAAQLLRTGSLSLLGAATLSLALKWVRNATLTVVSGFRYLHGWTVWHYALPAKARNVRHRAFMSFRNAHGIPTEPTLVPKDDTVKILLDVGLLKAAGSEQFVPWSSATSDQTRSALSSVETLLATCDSIDETLASIEAHDTSRWLEIARESELNESITQARECGQEMKSIADHLRTTIDFTTLGSSHDGTLATVHQLVEMNPDLVFYLQGDRSFENSQMSVFGLIQEGAALSITVMLVWMVYAFDPSFEALSRYAIQAFARS